MEITKEEFIAYEKVRQSGVTNMFNVELVSQLSDLSRLRIYHIMANYTELNKRWPDVRSKDWGTEHSIGIANLDNFKGDDE